MIPPIANRFVAGEGPAEALEHARALDDRGVGTILNRLGEHYTEREPADEDAAAYLSLLDDLAGSDARVCISVKPSQIGLDVGEDVFRENLRRVAEHAAERDVFVWLDMEDHTTTDATLAAFEEMAPEVAGEDAEDPAAPGAGLGLCLQANLRRTGDDVDRLADVPGKIRLVKGAYDPPADVAYRSRERVNDRYVELLGRLFETREGGVAVATHDPAMLDHAERLADEHGADYEVQMLMGVRESAQYDLAGEVPVWQYVPYGGKWLSYFYRRLVERKENVLFVLRAVLGR